jgi:DNA-binding HxlR family transcriptional regulator
VVSGKWLLPVMAELVDGPKRHNQLSRAVQLDHKRLGRVLRRAQEAQIVTREADTSRPRFAVQYRLTGYGKDLVSILAALGSVSQDGEA